MYTNADQLPNKITALNSRVQIDNPDIIVITEVNNKHASHLPEESFYTIPGYQIHSKNLTRGFRGLAIYTSNSLVNVSEISAGSDFSEHLMLSIQVNHHDKLLLCGIYRSERGTEENNNELLKLLVKINALKYKHKLILGDFNYRNIYWDMLTTSKSDKSREHLFLETLKDCYYTQHVDRPTRSQKGKKASILDLIITDEENRVDDIDYQSPLGNSDHGVLVFEYKVQTVIKSNRRVIYSYNKGDYKAMSDELKQTNWETLSPDSSTEEMWQEIKSKTLGAQEKYIPKIDTQANSKWMSKGSIPLNAEIRKEIKYKHRLWQRYYSSHIPQKFEVYKVQRNKVKRLLEAAQVNYEKGVGNEAKKNPKKLWKYVKTKLKSKPGIAPLMNSKTKSKSNTEEEKAEILSDYFAEVLEEEPQGEIPYLAPRTLITPPLTDIDVTPEKVLKRLKNINPTKSPGPDNLHPKVIKENATALLPIIHPLIKKSIDTGTLPKDWKQANITAIFKKGKKSDPGNYRPVSLTCILCKETETQIKEAVEDHFITNRLFSNKQYAFIRGRSTQLQFLKILEEWTQSLDEGLTIDNINMDFTKAFDKVPHRRLLYKLTQYGVEGKVHSWIKNFLHDRQQTVIVNGYKSQSKPVISGIPQGSVLGALLFIIYINDMPEQIQSNMYLFADDTKFFHQVTGIEDAITIQDDIRQLEEWSRLWLLKFHPDKCVLLRIALNSNQQEYKYKLGTKSLNQVNETKDLGVIVDRELRFKTQITKMVNKANSIMGTVRRCFRYLNYFTFKQIYCAQIRSILEYASAFWDPYQKKDIVLIESVQKKATKYLQGMQGLNYEQRLRKLNLPTLAYRRLRGSMIETYKIFNTYDKEAAPNLQLCANPYPTRGHHQKLYYSRSNKRHPKLHAFNQRIVRPWNSLPQEVINKPNLDSFKNALDKHWNNLNLKFSYLAPLNF